MIHGLPVKTYNALQNHIITIIIRSAFVIIIHLNGIICNIFLQNCSTSKETIYFDSIVYL